MDDELRSWINNIKNNLIDRGIVIEKEYIDEEYVLLSCITIVMLIISLE